MTCKFDIYGNGKCFHAKHQPYGGQCEPPNCYCFRKGDKLSPDEKDSLKQSENDFATGNVLTKDEAFEKLGWKESK